MRTVNQSQTRILTLGLLFGIAFGFLLQKGGVGKFHVLLGQLLLEDFTVVRVMLTAIVVGMVTIYALRGIGLVDLEINPTRIGANSIGGIIFGVGFGLAVYCPGTNIVALAQGNFDALAVALGLIVGSYFFALSYGFFQRTILRWGDCGEITIPQLLRIRPVLFVPICAVVLASLLILIDRSLS